MAGTVEAAGANVTGFRPGDEVFGGLEDRGTLAEYISMRRDAVVLTKPAGLPFDQAASVPVTAFAALQALRDKGRVQPGQRVLVNGAPGGVGTFAVQIAEAFGAEVTAVCSTPNVEMVASIGAGRVVDYIREDFTRARRQYDLLIDIVGSRSLAETRGSRFRRGCWWRWEARTRAAGLAVGPLGRGGVAITGGEPADGLRLARQNKDDLAVLHDLLEAGKVTPVIDRTYPLCKAAGAIGYLEQGHARERSSSPCEPF
jgi:NADPH:quinone reductase-like Zn-dependent oxidoreductase